MEVWIGYLILLRLLDFQRVVCYNGFMPDKITNELIYEVLKSVQSQVAIVREDTESIKSRLSQVDTKLATLHTDIAHQSDRMDRVESRLGRVETRLNFTDEAQ